MSALPEALLEVDQCQRGPPPASALALPLHAGPPRGLSLVLDRDDAVADRDFTGDGKIEKPARGFMRDDLEMDRFTANDAAERDRAVIGAALALRGIERNGDRGW